MSSSPPDLAGLQSAFLDALDGSRPIDPTAVFLAPPSGTAAARWHVYESAYTTRLVDALEHDFPAVARIAGRDAFQGACVRYLRARRPRSHDLGRAGDRFAAWLPTDALAGRLPFVPDLAQFEWALAEAFVAEDASPARWDDLAARGADALAETILAPLPGTRVIRSAWPLPDLHELQQVADGLVDVPIDGRPATLVVFRRNLEATWQILTEGEADFLDSLNSGRTLASLIDALGDDAQPAQIDELVATSRRMIDASILRASHPLPPSEIPRP
jgi:hypothetical protein